MTFWIDIYEEIITDTRVIQIRNDKRYVRYEMSAVERQWYEIELNPAQRREWKKYILAVLCDKWLRTHGETIYAIPPSNAGEAWLITYTPPNIDGDVVQGELEVTDAERKTIGDR